MSFQLNRISFVALLAAIAALSGCISDNAGLSRNSSDRIVALTTPNNMRAHLQHVKLASVRILVNGQPSGSGFIISPTGLVATCFHVVQRFSPDPTPADPGRVRIEIQGNIEVQLSTGEKIRATPHPSLQGVGFQTAVARDFFLLNIGGQDRPFLRLGSFSDASEGDSVLSCGFPLGIGQAVAATGILSAKWETNNYLYAGDRRAVAWLDLTMNKGNSGGPVVPLGDRPEDAKVIGIATFILNPFANPAEQLLGSVNQMGANMVMGGVDFQGFARLTASALSSASMGVSGCVSIDYCRALVP